MQISQVVELENGAVKFEGNLSSKEVGFLVEWAVNNLIAQGIMPYVIEEGSTTMQDWDGQTQ